MTRIQPADVPEVHAFRSAFGRLCYLAAEALARSGSSREAVRVAFQGHGDNINLAHLRAQRAQVNAELDGARVALQKVGFSKKAITTLIVQTARDAREAVEGEWRVRLPITNPHP